MAPADPPPPSFQEEETPRPVAPLPSQNASHHPDTSATSMQFQEPIAAPPIAQQPDASARCTAEHQGEKRAGTKEEEAKSPELEAAEAVLQERGLV